MAVQGLAWLEAANRENFERICRLAATLFQVPTVLITVVETHRQWFLGQVGFDAPEAPIETSFGAHALAQREVMQVHDARLDPRFSSHPLVVAPEGVRFYAGAPLYDRYGHGLGSLCLIDKRPRRLEPEQIVALQDFAEMVMVQVDQCQLLKYRDPLRHLTNLQQSRVDTSSPPNGSLLAMIGAEAAEQLARLCVAACADNAQDTVKRRAQRLLDDFPHALANGEVHLEYQPRFNLLNGHMVSAEALIGWRHPTLGKLSPSEFIPLIEGSGNISMVTRWLIDRALGDLASCVDRDVRLALNLSPLDFQNLDIAQALQDACKRHDIEFMRLEVEITEGAWVKADPQIIRQLTTVRALGVDVAIDDFGTGYSNFAYLHEIPANVLKLDQSLVTDLEHSPRKRIIAQTVFELARKLGYRTVAEGIETFRCLRLVREYGCDEGQGYFMSRPLALERFKRHCGEVPLAFHPSDVPPQGAFGQLSSN
ncbi:GAF domain/cyclic diguanylate phosphodiesterase (EAL) domain-containing protein [Pseudomonas sp. M47T1]|nr:GAF domain/cyclic diguanylate phosphodiesterase (EAL) domain-containing protein [Pseudomonas sp. M47T1]